MTDDDTRAYYEAEARLRLRPIGRAGLRVELRQAFHRLLRNEGRTSVVDFGAGPAVEGASFTEAGLRYVGIDVAVGNGLIAAEQGLHVVPGDVAAPPLRPRSFDAGWSMSVLMHLPAAEAARAAAALADTLVPGAPFWIGLWGGPGGLHYDHTIEGQRRPYHQRTVQENSELLTPTARVEGIDVHETGDSLGEYQVFRLRSLGEGRG